MQADAVVDGVGHEAGRGPAVRAEGEPAHRRQSTLAHDSATSSTMGTIGIRDLRQRAKRLPEAGVVGSRTDVEPDNDRTDIPQPWQSTLYSSHSSAEAVRIALGYRYGGPGDGARFVSLPTHHTRNVARFEGRAPAYVESCLEIPESDPMPGELPEILDLIAAADVVFNTGHVSGPEAVRGGVGGARRGRFAHSRALFALRGGDGGGGCKSGSIRRVLVLLREPRDPGRPHPCRAISLGGRAFCRRAKQARHPPGYIFAMTPQPMRPPAPPMGWAMWSSGFS